MHPATGESLHSVVTIRRSEFAWADSKMVLTDVDINIPAHQLTMVVGPVASGKSTLAKALIGQLPYIEGQILY